MTLSILKATLHDLRTGRELSAQSATWLVKGFEKYLRRGNLEKHLVLSIPAQPGSHFFQPQVIEKYAKRNQIIKELAATQPGTNTWQRSKHLAATLQQYPGRRSDMLDELFDCAVPVPRSAKQIQRILNGENAPDRTL